MKNLSTSGGRLFSVTVEGPRTTLRDAMVAAPLYLRSLEEQFGNAEKLLLCLRAWQEDSRQQPADVSDQRLERVMHWMAAHGLAHQAAKPWLSNPEEQTFSLRVVSDS
ncbi:hypothetical protein [Pararhizobium sp.]|uniref:hypothetical protein n=1 Tax=Pararhizobium sp. TaxID=1977563 RepID=UPI00271B71CA|nr:hypothetical protein [Pararhizobium sp.]MDO9415482.1 hypothetical protein [Pararhizobium sp.]